MRKNEKKLVKSKSGVYAQGKMFSKESYKHYREYQQEYQKKTYRMFNIRFSYTNDAELIEWMENQEQLAPYIRDLVTKDMEKKKKKQKK